MTNAQFEALLKAVTRISHGDIGLFADGEKGSGPMGLEALGMSIEGEGGPGHNNLSDAIKSSAERIAEAIEEHAAAMRDVTEAIEGLHKSL